MSAAETGKEIALKLVQETKLNGLEIARVSRPLFELGQRQADRAEAVEKVLGFVTSSGMQWQPMIDAFQYERARQDAILQNLGSISVTVSSTSGTAAAATVIPLATPAYVFQYISAEKQDQALPAVKRLAQEIHKEADKEAVLKLLRTLGLSTAPQGQISPVESFETAWAVYEKPVNDSPVVSASLIPMRECINAAVARLLQYRPNGEETGSHEDNKLLSIGKQLFDGTVPQNRVECLAEQWKSLNNELGGLKQKDLPRDDWFNYLLRATLLLKELLESLNPSKFRQH